MEGVGQSVDFIASEFYSYCINVDVEDLNCNDNSENNTTVYIAAANNSQASPNAPASFYNDFPPVLPGDDVEIIGSFSLGVGGAESHNYTFVPFRNVTGFQVVNTAEIVGCKTRMKINSVEIVCETTSLTDIVSQVGDKTVSLSSVNSSTFNYVSYEWDFGDGNGSNEASPTHTYGDCGAYEVCLNVVDENGCCGELCEYVVIEGCEDFFCTYICHEEVGGLGPPIQNPLPTVSQAPSPFPSVRCVTEVNYVTASGTSMNMTLPFAYNIYDFDLLAQVLTSGLSAIQGVTVQVFREDPREEIQCYKAGIGETYGYFAFGNIEIINLAGHKNIDTDNNCKQGFVADATGGPWLSCN